MLYALTFVIPIFVSRVIPNMSATQTGDALHAGLDRDRFIHVARRNGAPNMSPKFMVLIGIILSEVSFFVDGAFHCRYRRRHDVFVPLILRGIAMAFLFIPINQMVLGSFRGEELGQVAGMQNFFRQMGGSIGIASLSTLITRFSAQHYNDMMSNVNALNPAAQQTLMQTKGLSVAKMSSQLGLWDSTNIAIKSLHGRVLLQCFILSFEQLCWVVMGIVAFGLVPLYLIKYTPPKGGGPILDSH